MFDTSSKIEINLWVYSEGEYIYIYDKELPNTEKLFFLLELPDFGQWKRIEDLSLEDVTISSHETIKKCNRCKLKLGFLRASVKGWCFEEAITFSDGFLSEESYSKLLSLHPLILERLVEPMDKLYLSEKDEEILAKQSFQLFDSKSSGVSNPHPMISFYCLLSSMWEKFGLNYFDLQKLPTYERNALRRICEIENNVKHAELKAMDKPVAHPRRGASAPRRRR